MTPISWTNPVRLSFGRGEAVTIEGPRDALDYLLSMWPLSDGEMFQAAKTACMEADAGVIPIEESREALIAAAREANLKLV
ncbi:DUF982 domain-containing protein [Pararhizobium gei]|uniref:DUF982 domain-containing protein n=1 Tax=Pararhizobium gei TaxID=1395951 RepID=UPI0023DCE78A|nr:DUF982 domain-containing protein [Rhizobium gei]